MKARYASMPDWLYRFLGITEEMDKTAFRQHDRNYGLLHRPNGMTRLQADIDLGIALLSHGMAFWKVVAIFYGCRWFIFWKWE